MQTLSGTHAVQTTSSLFRNSNNENQSERFFYSISVVKMLVMRTFKCKFLISKHLLSISEGEIGIGYQFHGHTTTNFNTTTCSFASATDSTCHHYSQQVFFLI